MAISRAFKHGDCHGPGVAVQIHDIAMIVTQTKIEARERTWIEAYGVPSSKMAVYAGLIVIRVNDHTPAYVLST